MNIFKSLLKMITPAKYKIVKYGEAKFVAFYSELDVWWVIHKDGTCGVSEDYVMRHNVYYSTIEEAGAAVNTHATNGGAEIVWIG